MSKITDADLKFARDVSIRCSVDVCEIERNSPEADPTACIVYAPEISDIVERRILEALALRSKSEAVAWQHNLTGVIRTDKPAVGMGLLEDYTPLYTHPAPATVVSDAMDVDHLAQIIRRVDGDNKLGAGQLAEALVAALTEEGA